MEEELVLYSSHCPRCDMIEKLLEQKGIPYTVIDEPSVYEPLAEENGIEVMPFAKVENRIYTSKELIKKYNVQE